MKEVAAVTIHSDLSPLCPARGAARSGAPQMRDPGYLKETGVPGLQRITKRCCAAPGTQAAYSLTPMIFASRSGSSRSAADAPS